MIIIAKYFVASLLVLYDDIFSWLKFFEHLSLIDSYVGEQPGYPWSGGRVPCGHLRVDSVRSGLLIASNKLHLQCIH